MTCDYNSIKVFIIALCIRLRAPLSYITWFQVVSPAVHADIVLCSLHVLLLPDRFSVVFFSFGEHKLCLRQSNLANIAQI